MPSLIHNHFLLLTMTSTNSVELKSTYVIKRLMNYINYVLKFLIIHKVIFAIKLELTVEKNKDMLIIYSITSNTGSSRNYVKFFFKENTLIT